MTAVSIHTRVKRVTDRTARYGLPGPVSIHTRVKRVTVMGLPEAVELLFVSIHTRVKRVTNPLSMVAKETQMFQSTPA